MTTLESRPNTALLVVDVQNGVVEGAHERDVVVANVASLVEKARQEGVPVVWVQHSDEHLARGSDRWRIVPELTPSEADNLNYQHQLELGTSRVTSNYAADVNRQNITSTLNDFVSLPPLLSATLTVTV